MKTRILNEKELEYIYQTFMVEAFPEAELKPLSLMLEKQKKGICQVYAGFEEQREGKDTDASDIRAYAIFQQPEPRQPFGKDSYVLLDYFAVVAGLRGQGVGSRFLSELLPTLGVKGVLLEVEDPDVAETKEERDTRERRIRFYQRMGCRMTEGIKETLFGVQYRLLVWSEARHDAGLDAGEVKEALEKVYREVIPEHLYHDVLYFQMD